MKTPRRFLMLCLLAGPLAAEIPKSIPHQGRIAVGGVNFDGSGQFKFLLFTDPDANHGSGNESPLWSNSATSPANLGEPGSAVAAPVAKGLYGTWLGDTSIANMAALPPSLEPPAGSQLYLRIWFSNGVAGFQALAPDQCIAAVPFALHAAGVTAGGVTAGSLADGAVTSAKLATGSVTQGKIATGAVDAAMLADGAVTEAKLAPGAVVGVGIPGEVGSIFSEPVIVARDFDQTGMSSPVDVAIQGNFAYVVDDLLSVIRIFDVSDPNAIIARDFNAIGPSPKSVKVLGNFAYVVSASTSNLQIFDVSNPNNIVARDSDSTGLISPVSVAVQGNFAYVVDVDANRLQIFDISNPDNIVARDFDSTGMSFPRSVAVQGNFAYVVDSDTDRLQIFDISNPNNIVARDFDSTGMNSPRSVAVQGNFAYVVDVGTFRLQIFDVSNPDNIVARDSNEVGLNSPVSVKVIEKFAYVVDATSDRLLIFDVSNPDNIVAGDFDSTGLNTPLSLAVQGNFAYVVDTGTDRLQMFQISTPTVAGAFNVTGPTVMRDLSITGNLISGSLTASNIVVTSLTADSVSANSFAFLAPKAFTLNIPGCAMLPQTSTETYLRSPLGFIQSLSSGTDTQFTGTAEVQLPQGATVTGMDLLYLDNSLTNSFTNISSQLRRLNTVTTGVSPENIITLNVPSPASPNNPGIVIATNTSPNAGIAVVNNANFQYFVTVDFTATAPDGVLRFYGFRIQYTLQTLAP